MSENKTKKLVLFDHDETLSIEDPIEGESMIFAFSYACERLGLPCPKEIDIEKLRHDTKGTTERNLIKYFCATFNIPPREVPYIEEKFYMGRAKWYENMKSCGEYMWSTYLTDGTNLLNACAKDPNCILGLVTGNPRQVAKVKISENILKFFSHNDEIIGAFGDEEDSRVAMIERAITKAQQSFPEFSPKLDEMGFATNIFYIGDSRSDFFSALKAKICAIWVPSRNLRKTIDIATTDSISYISELLGSRTLITNDLFGEKVLNMLGVER